MKGYRGKPALHEASAVKALVGLSNLMADADGRIASIDVNPFLINSKLGVAVDGLIVLNNEAARKGCEALAAVRSRVCSASDLRCRRLFAGLDGKMPVTAGRQAHCFRSVRHVEAAHGDPKIPQAGKLIIGFLFLAVLASNVWTISRWSETRGVYDDLCYLR